MKKLRLSHHARARLKKIASHSIENFGASQADKYEQQLISRLGELCSGNPPAGKPCEVLAGRDLSAEGLLFYRVGMHYVIYQQTEAALLVYDFVHVRRNLPALFAAIEAEVLK